MYTGVPARATNLDRHKLLAAVRDRHISYILVSRSLVASRDEDKKEA